MSRLLLTVAPTSNSSINSDMCSRMIDSLSRFHDDLDRFPYHTPDFNSRMKTMLFSGAVQLIRYWNDGYVRQTNNILFIHFYRRITIPLDDCVDAAVRALLVFDYWTHANTTMLKNDLLRSAQFATIVMEMGGEDISP